jgi:hypothetical protein
MFNLDQAIADWRRRMAAGDIKNSEVLDELESHLREDVEQQIHLGLSAQQAFEAAIERMGEASELKAEFAKAGVTRPALRARLVSTGCFVSAAFMALVGTWTLLEFEPSPAKRIFGLSALWLIAFFSGGLPFVYRLLPSLNNVRARGTFKGLSIVVHAWVFLAFFSAVQIVHVEIGITLTMIFWALCLAYVATVFTHMSHGHDQDADLAATLATLTPVARRSLGFAHDEASQFHHDFIGTEHVLLGLLKLEDGAVRNVLERMGADYGTVRAEIEKVVGSGPSRPAADVLPYTPRVKKALRLAAAEAKTMNNSHTSSEHVLLGLLVEGRGVAALVLKDLNINPETARAEILREWNP